MRHAHLAAGQHVLVNGGAGGVGNYAVQIAAALGARVSATAAARDAAFVAGLGAGQVIDYARPMDKEVSDVDIVVDTAGRDAVSRAWRTLRPGGTLISVASPLSPADVQRHQVRAVYFIVEPDREGLIELARLAHSGKLRAAAGRVFPLADAAAFDALAHQHTRGKVMLSIRPEAHWTGSPAM